MFKKNLKEKGVSLLELLLYIGISAIVLTVIGDITYHIFRLRGQEEAKIEAIENLNYFLEKASQDIRKATAVSVAGSCPDTTMTLTIGGSSVVYQREYDASSGNYLIKKTTGGSDYYLTNDKINMDIPLGECLFEEIQNPSAPSTIRIQVEAEYKASFYIQDIKSSGQITVSLRQ